MVSVIIGSSFKLENIISSSNLLLKYYYDSSLGNVALNMYVCGFVRMHVQIYGKAAWVSIPFGFSEYYELICSNNGTLVDVARLQKTHQCSIPFLFSSSSTYHEYILIHRNTNTTIYSNAERKKAITIICFNKKGRTPFCVKSL